MRHSRSRPKLPRPSARPPLPDPSPTEEEDTGWFDSASWQAGEAEVDEHLQAGRVKTYESVDDLLAELHREAAP